VAGRFFFVSLFANSFPVAVAAAAARPSFLLVLLPQEQTSTHQMSSINNNNRLVPTNIAEAFGSFVSDEILKENAALRQEIERQRQELAAVPQELVRSTVMVEWAGPPDPSVDYADVRMIRRDEQQGWVVYGDLTYLKVAAGHARFARGVWRRTNADFYDLTGARLDYNIRLDYFAMSLIRIPGNSNFSVPMSAFNYFFFVAGEIHRTGSRPEDMQYDISLCGSFVDPDVPAESIFLSNFSLYGEDDRPLLLSVQQLSTLTGWTVPQVVARCSHRRAVSVPLVGSTLNLLRDICPPCYVHIMVQNVKVSRAFLWNKVERLSLPHV
jgi:hypothetical protein